MGGGGGTPGAGGGGGTPGIGGGGGIPGIGGGGGIPGIGGGGGTPDKVGARGSPGNGGGGGIEESSLRSDGRSGAGGIPTKLISGGASGIISKVGVCGIPGSGGANGIPAVRELCKPGSFVLDTGSGGAGGMYDIEEWGSSLGSTCGRFVLRRDEVNGMCVCDWMCSGRGGGLGIDGSSVLCTTDSMSGMIVSIVVAFLSL